MEEPKNSDPDQPLSGSDHFVRENLKRLRRHAREYAVDDNSKIVIFSDLHMGSGRRGDDFRQNGALFAEALDRYYIPEGHTLILNGDIEELQRFRIESIRHAWAGVFDRFENFRRRDKLIKIYGNHDALLRAMLYPHRRFPVISALRLLYGEDELFLFHGHQASRYYEKLNLFIGFILKAFAGPLGIKNLDRSYANEKWRKLEGRVYDFSVENKIVSVIGHTHRALFESISRLDLMRFEIEKLVREFHDAPAVRQRQIEAEVTELKEIIRFLGAPERIGDPVSRLYSADVVVPCLFNSGSGIGRRGITALEIDRGEISLVHWFDALTQKQKPDPEAYEKLDFEESSAVRIVLRKDELRYIFNRIRLLA